MQTANSDAPRSAGMLTWAAQVAGEHADLLERQAAPVPVAVSERLPGAEDCDALGACWWYAEVYGWEMHHREHPRSDRWSHWLPAHALPLPSGEVEA